MLNQPLFAALDVSLATTTICIMSADGTIIKEAVVATEPESIAICLGDDLTRIERIGLEAGPLSEWLVRELSVLGIVVTLLETRQVRAALSAMIIKTDRKDARGMAHLLRTGWFRPVHVKSLSAREQRAMLAARSMLVARLKDIENSVRGLLRGFGLRLPRALRGRWEAGVREAIEGHPTLVQIFNPARPTEVAPSAAPAMHRSGLRYSKPRTSSESGRSRHPPAWMIGSDPVDRRRLRRPSRQSRRRPERSCRSGPRCSLGWE